MVSLQDFMEAFPDGKVLRDPDDLSGDYNPYLEYDTDEKPTCSKATQTQDFRRRNGSLGSK